ncbi:NUDIX hydrolase [Trichocoleus sp. DQ-A3]|uniref:NUDIX hydrolase n=1 Tax=Cyanophyceae TaxID=3028117 RepID=UPI0016820F15|nr:NUDIX hydrolase [Coleofasciculus sp. FACHB-125]MBD1900338.1 NUDIX hydrolase [Coleofasciculus sp. FACHB-125]
MNLKSAQRYAQSAVIPYRIKNGKIEVLLITSSTGKRWVIPKGMIEPFMTPQTSAAKEAWEEAGIIGQVLPTLMGTYEYQKGGGTCRVEVFLMQVKTVLEVWPEASFRKRQWVSVKQAVKRVEEAELKRIFMTFADTLFTLQSPLE